MATTKTSTRKSTAKTTTKTTERVPQTTTQSEDAVIASRIAELEQQVDSLQTQLATLKAASTRTAATPAPTTGDVVDKALLRKTLEAIGVRQHKISALGLK